MSALAAFIVISMFSETMRELYCWLLKPKRLAILYVVGVLVYGFATGWA